MRAASFLCSPFMTATLADEHGDVCGFQLLLFGRKYLDDQSRDSQEYPFDGEPPPANECPPEATPMLCFELRFRHHLHVYVGRSAAGAFSFRWLAYLLFDLVTGSAGWAKVCIFANLLAAMRAVHVHFPLPFGCVKQRLQKFTICLRIGQPLYKESTRGINHGRFLVFRLSAG